ncbi:MAG: galactokinase [Oligoflexia bacterium]|nr:galactokinase [Oligoflexia bacterium]MBF0366302.1 galactokinase [Oligoflexia bacterium]
MIITRSPLRISLGGGGTDLPSYYENYGGFLMAAAINKYVYITIHEIFRPGFIIKYSEIERVEQVCEVKHPIIREVMSLSDVGSSIKGKDLEIVSMADIHSGTGLGSSGSFTTALIKAFYTFGRKHITTHDLAECACDIEINKLKEPIGKQDQFIAAYGGVSAFHFSPNGEVKVRALELNQETLYTLEDNLMLYFTGIERNASDVLRDQHKRSLELDKSMLDNLHYTKEIGIESEKALLNGDLRHFAELMNTHWQHKRVRSKGISSERVNEIYDYAMKNGALGGKLIGAGGGGFFLFYAEEKSRLRSAMASAGLREERFRFDFEGTKVVAS